MQPFILSKNLNRYAFLNGERFRTKVQAEVQLSHLPGHKVVKQLGGEVS